MPWAVRFWTRDQALAALLQEQADAVHRAAEALRAYLGEFRDPGRAGALSGVVRGIERRGDELERAIADRLNRSAQPPQTRGDIHAMANKMESILDILEGVANRVELYSIAALIPEVAAIADQLAVETAALCEVVGSLRAPRPALPAEAARRLKAIEGDVDRLYREGVARLFNEPDFPPLEVLKLKEILERLEEASDHCEDVTALVEEVILKHA
jgi:predicted phosphate transport protein (TIGR00153 family)